MTPIRTILVGGARPNFMKAAAVVLTEWDGHAAQRIKNVLEQRLS